MRSKREARNPPASDRRLVRVLLVAAVIPGIWLAYLAFWRGSGDALVVYCAHDSIHAEAVLRAFERRTGLSVSIRYDTEATKSLGLVELLVRERSRPRCEVFWNNQLLGTEHLRREGLLLPYRSPNRDRIPERFRDPGGCWTGFAARLRVYIVNTRRLEADPAAVDRALEGDLARVAVARPLYGTTLTHYAAHWSRWGRPRLVAWHRDWRRRGVREVPGNADVKRLVADGVCDVGITDTDDFFSALDEGKPVAMVPVRFETGAVLCIPNTVAILRGGRNPEAAKALVDFLLSADAEAMLAASRARQIPLGPVDTKRLPPEVKAMQKWMGRALLLRPLAGARAECLAWLKSEYLP